MNHKSRVKSHTVTPMRKFKKNGHIDEDGEKYKENRLVKNTVWFASLRILWKWPAIASPGSRAHSPSFSLSLCYIYTYIFFSILCLPLLMWYLCVCSLVCVSPLHLCSVVVRFWLNEPKKCESCIAKEKATWPPVSMNETALFSASPLFQGAPYFSI